MKLKLRKILKIYTVEKMLGGLAKRENKNTKTTSQ
jgi:hypothetical protein